MSVSRRRFLNNITLGSTATLLTPVLRQLQARADGVQQQPKRVVIVMEGNGLPPNQVQPLNVPHEKERTELVDLNLRDLELPTALEPLNQFKDRLTILQGLSSKIVGAALHSADFGALGCFPRSTVAGETLNVAIGRALPALFPNVTLGMIDDPAVNVVYNCSASGRDKRLPTICRPDFAFATLFGSVAEGSSRKVVEARTSLLDYMTEDLRRVEKQLATPEREQLSHYLQSFEAMHARQTELTRMREQLKKHAQEIDQNLDIPTCMGRLAAQFDIGAAALTSGLTNSLVIASGVGNSFFMVKYPELGIGIDKHKIGHKESDQGRDWETLAVMIRKSHFELIAKFAKKLASIPEGDGTMLDNTLILYTSDGGEWHHPVFNQWPFVLLGDLGGKLKTRGRLLEYPSYGKPGHRTAANLFMSILHAVGNSRETFGIADPALKDFDQKGPLAELLA
jgi:hypothetical protein